MVVNDLLDYWLNKGWTKETTICSIHDPLCSCVLKSKVAVIDFDAVKMGYEKQHKIASPASVDALRYDEKELTFIEVKGWKKFLDFTGKVTEEKIDKKRKDYEYKKKLDDSLNICLQTIREQNLISEDEFCRFPKRYIVVIDVQVKKEPLASLAVSLQMLATSSTSWDTMCWQKTQSDVDQIPQEDYSGLNMKHPHLVSCSDFDACFSSP